MRPQPILPFTLLLFFASSTISAQDLDPRAYVRAPVNATTMIPGFVYSHGDVVTDATLPIDNIKANVAVTTLAVAHTFSLFGLSSQALIVAPYSWAKVTGDVGDQSQQINRSGFGDMRLRFSVLLHGAPAATLAQLRKAPPKTIIGASLSIIAPTGQFYPDKLINIGTHRWSFKPELAISQPVGKNWLLDFYAGIWLFTSNASFYPGSSMRRQDPLGALQAHFSYNVKPGMWVAFDATFYNGGSSSIEGVYKDDRQSNTRFGFTALLPTGRSSSLKFSASKGVVVRIGQDFTSYAIGWQHSWIPGLKPAKAVKPQ